MIASGERLKHTHPPPLQTRAIRREGTGGPAYGEDCDAVGGHGDGLETEACGRNRNSCRTPRGGRISHLPVGSSVPVWWQLIEGGRLPREGHGTGRGRQRGGLTILCAVLFVFGGLTSLADGTGYLRLEPPGGET